MVAIGLNEVDTLISYQEMKISFYSSCLGYIEKQPTIKFTDNISGSFWIHETRNGINRNLNFGQLKHHPCTLNIQ